MDGQKTTRGGLGRLFDELDGRSESGKEQASPRIY